MWRPKEPSCTFEFSGSNTAFYSRSLTTTQETKKFMARIEVPWRLQIDKPDQWRGHHRRPFQRKKVSVMADGGWSERHSTYISWLSVKKLKNWDYPWTAFENESIFLVIYAKTGHRWAYSASLGTCLSNQFVMWKDDLSSRSQLLIEAFEILNIYFASTFAMRPYQALTTKSQQDRQFV